MAKDIKFNIKLAIDGKQVVVDCKKNVRELGIALGGVTTKANSVNAALSRLSSVSTLFRNGMDGVRQLGSAMQPFIDKANAATSAQTKLTTVMRQRMNASEADVAVINKMVASETELGIVSGTVQRFGLQKPVLMWAEEGTKMRYVKKGGEVPPWRQWVCLKVGRHAQDHWRHDDKNGQERVGTHVPR